MDKLGNWLMFYVVKYLRGVVLLLVYEVVTVRGCGTHIYKCICRVSHFLCCMECRRGLAMRILSVRLSVLANLRIGTVRYAEGR